MPRCTYKFQLRNKNGRAIHVSKKRSQLSLQEILEIEELAKIIIYPGFMVDIETGITESFKKLWISRVGTPISKPLSELSKSNQLIYERLSRYNKNIII